jgi:deazaflavin-dependent oxidoreductase (nitroreductase family)
VGAPERRLHRLGRLQRAFLRLPIWLYRARLGWLLGKRFLLLTHTGRASGKARRTVLEAIRHDPETGAYIVCSGWGERADWYRNILRTPDVTIMVGGARFPATAVRLSEAEGEQIFLAYARRHPRAFRNLTRILLNRRAESMEELCRQMGRTMPVVAFRPKP